MMNGRAVEVLVDPAVFGTDDEELYNKFITCFTEMFEKAEKEGKPNLGFIGDDEEA